MRGKRATECQLAARRVEEGRGRGEGTAVSRCAEHPQQSSLSSLSRLLGEGRIPGPVRWPRGSGLMGTPSRGGAVAAEGGAAEGRGLLMV